METEMGHEVRVTVWVRGAADKNEAADVITDVLEGEGVEYEVESVRAVQLVA